MDEEQKVSSYMARHNDTIIGFFGSETDAQNALSGYEMENKIELNDILEVLKVT